MNDKFHFYVNEEFYKNDQTVEKGDVIFVSTSETMEDLGHSVFYNREDIGLIGGEQILLKPNNNLLNGKFLFYSSNIFGKELKKFATGIKVFRFDTYDLKTVYIPVPPILEQEEIVNYLDKATSKIDRIIAIKEEQLERLGSYFTNQITTWLTKGDKESKTSVTHCYWLPEIKKGWKLQPLKRLLKSKLKYGANESAENEDVNEPRYIRITDFGHNGKLRDNTFKSLPLDKASPYMLKQGDVLFARSGATVGKTFIFKNYEGDACYAGYLIKAECDQNRLLPEFLYYFTKTKSYEEWKNLIFTQATIQNIGADKYQYLQIPTPKITEQSLLVDKIESLNSKIEAEKNNIKEQINTLISYRDSLVHECVTGKKQVAEIAK